MKLIVIKILIAGLVLFLLSAGAVLIEGALNNHFSQLIIIAYMILALVSMYMLIVSYKEQCELQEHNDELIDSLINKDKNSDDV